MPLTVGQADVITDIMYNAGRERSEWTSTGWFQMLGAVHQYLLDGGHSHIPFAPDGGIVIEAIPDEGLPGPAVRFWWMGYQQYDYEVVDFCSDGNAYIHRDGWKDPEFGGEAELVGTAGWRDIPIAYTHVARVEASVRQALAGSGAPPDVWSPRRLYSILLDMVRRLRRLVWMNPLRAAGGGIDAPRDISLNREAITMKWYGPLNNRVFVYKADNSATFHYADVAESKAVGHPDLADDGKLWAEVGDDVELWLPHSRSDWLNRQVLAAEHVAVAAREALQQEERSRRSELLNEDVASMIQTARANRDRLRETQQRARRPQPDAGGVLPRRIQISGSDA